MSNKSPFKFNKEHAATVLELGKGGASQKAMYAALGISRTTATRLKKEDPFFAETFDLATVYGQAFWEQMLLENVGNRNFNSRIAEICLRGQYPEEYRETREQKIDVKADVSIDFKGAVDDLIKKLKAAT